MNVEKYLMPKSVEQCLELLKKLNGEARIIAGGTDLILELKEKKAPAKLLIDITEIQELKSLQIVSNVLSIGAAITHAQIGSNTWISKNLPVLSNACNSIGSPQIRNIATLVGNIVSAQPAADAAIALIALNSKVEVISNNNKETKSVESLYKGIGKSKIDSSKEIITKILINLQEHGSGSAFMRFSPRNSLSLPIVNVATSIRVINDVIQKARIVMGPVAEYPFRPVKAEEILIGKRIDDTNTFREVAHVVSNEANPRDSIFRGSKEYRRKLIVYLVYNALIQAIENTSREEQDEG